MKNNILILVFSTLCIGNINAQESAIEVFQRASENIISKNNVYYKFMIKSSNESNIFPFNGELYLSGDKHFLNSIEIDQINDGLNVYTIIHDNKEIIVSSLENINFLINFTPYQILNFFMQDFNLDIEISNKDYLITAMDPEQENSTYKIFLDSSDLSINKVEFIENNEITYSFLTLTYDYNLMISPSLFKFEDEEYKGYLIVSQN
tara:strand:- start:26932 stop:27549 length:618 start_codon:yes stop_codon:yes gene_type:complete